MNDDSSDKNWSLKSVLVAFTLVNITMKSTCIEITQKTRISVVSTFSKKCYTLDVISTLCTWAKSLCGNVRISAVAKNSGATCGQ